jgi:hypothetical protein
MASDSIYKVHRSFFSRDDKHLCYALMLIDPNAPREGVGRLYRLRQGIGFGMELEVKREYNFHNSRSYKADGKVFSMPQSFRERFERIVSQTERPVQLSGLTDTNPGTPPRDERRWIKDIVDETRLQLIKAKFCPV